MDDKGKLRLYSFFLFLLFLVSMQLWIGWGHKASTMSILGIITFIVGYSKNIFKFNRKNVISSLILYATYIFVSLGFRERIVFTQIPSNFIPFLCVLCVKDVFKEYILQNITKWYAFIMVPSMVLWVLCLIANLPSFGTLYFVNTDYGGFHNFIFYVQPAFEVSRFNGPFLEPGHVGMIGAFILMANNFKITKYNIIILASIFLSFSLSGYMLVLTGYTFCLYYQGKLKLHYMVGSMMLLMSFVLFFKYYKGGENVVNEKIFSRFERDEEKGFVGNNRASFSVMILWNNLIEDKNLLLYGYDRDFQKQNEEMFTKSNGLVFFIVEHGIIGVIVTFLFYGYLALKADDRKYAFLFFLFIFICFFSRTYYNWIPWILCYDYSIVKNSFAKKVIRLHLK